RLGQRVLEERLQRLLLVVLAVERIGAARAALVDEHDVARVVELREERQHLGRERDRALPGAAREDEERVGVARTQSRRYHGDVEADAPAGPGASVLPHFVRAAARRGLDAGQAANLQLH